MADELYAESPDEFVDRRKKRADEARAAKDRPLVKAIGQLRRPTRSSWMVNLLARESPEDVRRLLELGAALGAAQRRASGPDLRRLSKERQTTLDALTRRATQLAAAHGHTATEASRQEVSQTLQAALADSSVAELVRTGRVVQPATYGGFGPIGLFAVPDLPEADAVTTTTSTPDEPVEEPPAEDPALVRARETLGAAEDELDRVQDEAAQAEQAADRATERADELADRVEALRAQLEDAEAQERTARAAARAARKELQARQQSASAAEEAVAAARQALAELEP